MMFLKRVFTALDKRVNGVGGVRGRGHESAGKGNQDCLLSDFSSETKEETGIYRQATALVMFCGLCGKLC